MRIQNNITAMNTHRQYTINNDNVAKAAEKLSSGYRINRAGDDAAGLAISEKMRSQIRGLNMATKNSQDAISLVQTAEGALQETHSMLQRMNELAVQAATGTNQEIDRNALAKEFEQLKREINDIAEQTTFNNMKILDGSLAYMGPERSAATAGINTTTSEIQGGSAIDAGTETQAGKVTAEGSITLTGLSAVQAVANGTATVSVGGTVVATFNNSTSGSATALKDITPTASSGYTVTWDGNDLVVKQSTAADKVFTGTVAVAATTDGTNAATGTFGSKDGKDGVAAASARVQKVDYTLDESKVNEGDKFVINGKSYTVGKEIDWDGTAGGLAQAIADAVGTSGDVKVTAGTGKITVENSLSADKKSLNGSTSVSFKAGDGSNTRQTIEFDTVKMRDGDTFEFTANGGKKYTYVHSSEKTANDMATEIAQGLGIGQAKGNALIADGANVKYELKQWGETDKDPNAIRIQVGALENEQLAVSIDSMNTAGLDLDDHNLDTQESAGAAITAVRAAVNKVSDQRATLGAMQNRLDHKIANLKVSSENLSAAESRIRDVDMASEMTNFTKNNILSQAATAMLAQANALPQNVLSLLG